MAERADEGRDEQPKWLNAQEREAWLSLTRVLSTLPAALDAQLERDADLNYFEYIVLAMLSEQRTRTLRMSELAEITNASLSRLSNVVKRLEQRGLLRREPDPEDGRVNRALLSDAGMQLVVRTAPGHVHAVRDLVIDAVTPTQLQQLHAAHQRVLARLDPDATTNPTRLDAGKHAG